MKINTIFFQNERWCKIDFVMMHFSFEIQKFEKSMKKLKFETESNGTKFMIKWEIETNFTLDSFPDFKIL